MGSGDVSSAFGIIQRSDWTTLPYDFDLTEFLPTITADVAQPSQDNTPDKAPDVPAHSDNIPEEPPAEGSSDARSACIKKLTSLLVDSDETCARLSLDPGLHFSQLEASDAFLRALSAKMATRQVLENFFVLAQRLIDVYPAAINTSLTPDLLPNSSCDIPECAHMTDLVPGLKEVEDGVLQQGAFAGPDIALTNLLVACHARQLDILDRLFLLITSCTRATLASRREPDFDVSEMRVGSFVPQRTAAVLVQVALVKHLAASLTDKLALFGKAVLAWTESSINVGLESSILKLQHESLTHRQANKVMQIGLIENFLLKFDFNKE